MGLVITWVPDDTSISSTLILSKGTRSVGEHNVRLNGRSLVETAELFRSPTVENFYRYNERVALSFDATRDMDRDGSTPFADAEGAFVFAALHTGGLVKEYAIAGIGAVKMILTGDGGTSVELVFKNAVKQSLDLTEWMGIALTFNYQFSCSHVIASAV